MLLCEPNISEGRDLSVVERALDRVRQVPGVKILDVSSDSDHNRSVFTYVGDPRLVLEATQAMAETALELMASALRGGWFE